MDFCVSSFRDLLLRHAPSRQRQAATGRPMFCIVDWRFPTAEARIKPKRFYPAVHDRQPASAKLFRKWPAWR